MRTRNANTPKTPTSQKKPTPAKKSTPKTPTSASYSPATVTAMVTESIPDPVTPAIQTPQIESAASTDTKPEIEQGKAVVKESVVSPPTTTTKKVTKRIVKRKVIKPKAKAVPAKSGESSEVNVEGQKDGRFSGSKDVDMKEDETPVKETESTLNEELGSPTVDVGASLDKGKTKLDVDEPSEPKVEVVGNTESPNTGDVVKAVESEEPVEPIVEKEEKVDEPMEEVNEIVEKQELDLKPEDDPKDVNDEQKLDDTNDDQKPQDIDDDQKPENNDDDQKLENMDEGDQLKEEDTQFSEEMEDYGEEEGFVEPGEEDLQEDDEPETVDETKALVEEQKELAAAAKERKIKKEHEIFVGGLDREVVEDDVKKAFEKVGDVVEVRLLKDPSTNKNRGFAFVRFATKDQSKRALSEMKNPVIRGKRCGVAPNEDNDTLFLGNICNTWTKEAIKQKLTDFSVEGVETINLVQDPRHEGLSRGFCFIHFDCHADAMFAYKRLQKTDAIFGHTERTAKVAFAEPLQEPDPEVMAKVKSVFVDGLPPHWDEDRVRKHFKSYGEIERITLARNMSSAKRKDFGFVDFTTHEAAIACIEDLKTKELADGNSKTKVKARLSNPQPKTQAVKGGMCGGFRIGRPTGKSFTRSGPSVNRPNFQQGRPFRGQFNEPTGPYGRRGPYRAVQGPPVGGVGGRPIFAGPRHGVVDRGFARSAPHRRQPFPIDDGGYGRPYMGRQFDDPYAYDNSHGLKRPYYMTDQDPAYMEPSRVRPRVDYSDSGRGTHFRDNYVAGSSAYSSGYYGADYGTRPNTSYNGRDRPYGGGSSYYY